MCTQFNILYKNARVVIINFMDVWLMFWNFKYWYLVNNIYQYDSYFELTLMYSLI